MSEVIKKTIQIYVIHPQVNNIEQMIALFDLDSLKDEFEFIWNDNNPDFLFVSEHIFYKRKYLKLFKKYFSKNVVSIFFAGECIAPDMNIFDYAVCWERDMHLGDRIIRISPTEVFFKNFVLLERKYIDTDDSLELIKNKNKFCNFIYSNPDAHPMRDMIFRKVSEYKRVDSLGKHLNNVGIAGTGFTNHHKDVTLLKDDYKFSIASENAMYDGYTSEKLLTSLQAHTVPIYWGNPSISEDFNEKAFLNVSDFESFETLLEEIKSIDESDEKWCQIVSQPWQTEQQRAESHKRMERYIAFFRNVFNQKPEDARRIPKGYHPNRYRKWFFESHSMWRIELGDFCRIIKNRLLRNRR